MKTKENNKLMAEFLGMIHHSNEIYPDIYRFKDDLGWHTLEEMKFDSSWDWLMPVVEKILQISLSEDGNEDEFNLIIDCIPDIADTYERVVCFIKWHNE